MKTNKIKTLLPSLKEKKRYLVFEVVSKSKIEFSDASKAVQKSAKNLLGDLGLAKAGMHVLPDKWKKNRGIIRVNHDMLDHVKASLAMVKEVSGEAATVQSVGVSGILKKAESNYL